MQHLKNFGKTQNVDLLYVIIRMQLFFARKTFNTATLNPITPITEI